ncbi:hypothetical protein KSF78_0005320 [Schistosoma japonicum]|nr:hypothetical protein KSF78_0005320 [Schistosoma japonicum]
MQQYYTHDSYGKSKYCIEVNLQGYPQESIHITRQLHDVTVSLNHEEIKPTGEKYKQVFKREIQLPQCVDLDTLKCTVLNKNTLLLYADVNKREQPILKSSQQMSPNSSKRHINWELSHSLPHRNSMPDSPKLRTSFTSETRHQNSSSFTNLPNDLYKSFRLKKPNSMNNQNIHRSSNQYTTTTRNPFSRSEPIYIPVRVESNQNHRSSLSNNNQAHNIRVEVVKNQSNHLKQFPKQMNHQNHYQSESQFAQNNHTHQNNEYRSLNNTTMKSQRPLQIIPITNNIENENTPINNISPYNSYANTTNRSINHNVTTNTTGTTTNNHSLTKPTKFYTQSMKVGNDVKPEDLNIHLKNGLLTIMIKQKGNNIENNQQTKIAREFLHENTIPINVDQHKLIAKLDKGTIYNTTSTELIDNSDYKWDTKEKKEE